MGEGRHSEDERRYAAACRALRAQVRLAGGDTTCCVAAHFAARVQPRTRACCSIPPPLTFCNCAHGDVFGTFQRHACIGGVAGMAEAAGLQRHLASARRSGGGRAGNTRAPLPPRSPPPATAWRRQRRRGGVSRLQKAKKKEEGGGGRSLLLCLHLPPPPPASHHCLPHCCPPPSPAIGVTPSHRHRHIAANQ